MLEMNGSFIRFNERAVKNMLYLYRKVTSKNVSTPTEFLGFIIKFRRRTTKCGIHSKGRINVWEYPDIYNI